jgi:hypothetical protein
MLFSQSVTPTEKLLTSGRRERQLVGLLRSLGRQFPTILYELVPSPELLNAQALVLIGRRVVKLYGGLAFHPRLEMNTIAFVLLHETGHHLAAGSRLPWNPFLACECQADQWALRNGAVAGIGQVNIAKALSNLDALIPQHVSPVEGKGQGKCWTIDWQKRRSSLLANEMLPTTYKCPLRELSPLSGPETCSH